TTADAVARALSKGPGGGVFFLFGDEEYLKEETASAIVAAHLDPATRDFNYDQLRAGDVEPETLASILATPPMMAEWRVAVVREVQESATKARIRSVMVDVVTNPLQGTVVVVLATLPERSEAQISEMLKKKAMTVECTPLAAADVPGCLI